MKIKFKVAFILTSIILVASIMSVIYFTLLSHFEEVEGNRLNERVRSTARAVDNFMLTRVADFNVLSNNPLFSSSSSEVSSQYLARVVNQYPYYNNLFFANKEGVILSSSNQKFIGENILQFDPDIQNGINKTLSGGHEDVYISELSIATQKEITRNQPLDLKFFSDVIDLEGNVVGVLVGFMNMKPLNDLILYTDKISVGNKHTYLVNNKGVVFVSGNKEVEIFKQHPDLLINELQKKIEGGERGFYFNQNAKGLKLLSGYAALSKYGTDGVDNWFLLRTVPFNEIMKPFFKTVYIAVFIFLLIISLIVIFLFYSSTKKVKKSLLSSENREFSLKEASQVAKIGFHEYDNSTKTFTWSAYAYHIFGFDPKDGIPAFEEVLSLFDKDSLEKITKTIEDLDSKGISCDVETKLINKRNEELWVRYVAQPVYNEQNKIVGRRGVLQDITESKKAQLELELSKQKVQASLELLEKSEKSKNEASKTAKIGFVEDDIATETYTWSEYVFQIFGFDSNFPTPSAKEIEVLFEEESLEILKKSTLELDKFGISYDVELKLKNLRNEDTWIRLVVQPVYNKQNEIVKRRGVLQDITAAKTAQFELELSKEKIQKTLALLEKTNFSMDEASKVANIGYWEQDLVTNTFVWSDYIYQIFELNPKNGIPCQKGIMERFDKVSQEKLLQASSNIISKGINYDVELKFKDQKNKEIWIRSVGQPIYNQQNKIIGLRGVIQDITESKKAQLELELSKQKIQTSLELVEQSEQSKEEVSKVAKIGYWEEDFTTNKVVWSDYVYQIFEVNPTDGIPENSFIVEKFDNESQEKLIKIRQEITFKGIPYDVELKFVNLKKEDVWVRFVAQPVFNSQNEIIGRKGVLQDITVSKKVQLELELSKQKIQTSLELLEESERFKDDASKIAKIGYWSYDSITDTVKWSDYVFQIFGLKPQKNAPLLSETAKFFDEENQKKIAKSTLDVSTKGIPYDIELKFINTKNEEIWIRTKCQPIYNEHNEIIGRGGITQDITASKKAQLELELSKQKIQASLELLEKSEYSKNEGTKIAKIGYWEHNLITDTVVWSDYLYQVFEANPENGVPLQNELMEKFDKESQVKLTQATLDIISKGINYDIELKFKNLKNEDVWLRIVAQPIYNQQHKIVGKRGVMQNITAAKKIQLELESSKEKIETSLHLLEISEFAKSETSKIAKIGHWEYSIITDTFIWSDYIYEVYGLELTDKIPSRSEIIKFYDKPSQQILEQATLELDSKGIPYDVEMKLINRNNEEVWVRNVVQLVCNQQNEIIGRRGVLHNITAFKNAQQELEVSKQKIEEALVLAKKRKQSMDEASKMASIGFMDYNYETKSNTWSEHVYTIFGLDSSKPVPPQTEIAPFFDEESLEKHTKAVLDLSTNGIPYDIELKMNNFKNKEVWIRLATQGVYNQQNQIIGRRGLVQDITESKKAQFALELSNQKIQSALEIVQENEYSLKEAGRMAKIGYWSYSNESDRIFWSKAVHEIYGNDPENGVPDFNVIKSCYDKESLERFVDAIENLNHKAVSFDIELHLTNLKGQKRWIRNIGEAVFNDKNEIIGRRGVSQDITIQKEIEEKNLRISEEFKELFESVTTSIWNEDLSLIYKEIAKLRKQHIPNFKIYLENNPELIVSLIKKVKVNNVNKATLKLFKAKNLEEFRTNIDLTFGEGADKVFGKLLEAIWNNNKIFTSEVNYKKLNGDEFTALLSVPIPQTEAKQKSVPISIQSIQSIKDAESAKRELLLKLNNAEKLAHIGSWLFDVRTQENKWSEEMFYIWGFDRKKSVPELEKITGRIHKDDLNLFNSFFSAAVDNGTPYDIEFRICLPKDEIKWIRAICQPILGEDGNVVSLSGSNQNITAQKQALFKIEKAEEMYRLLTDNSNDLICLQEPDSTFKYVSPSIKHLLGYEVSDYLGKEVFSIVHPQDVFALQDAMKNKVFNNNFNEAYTLRIRHKKGHYIWFEFLSSPVYKDNEISYYVTSAREITQWILAKQEIQEYQTSLQKLTTEITLIEEKQKKEIASNIHDHLSQSLVISKMRINAMKKNARFKEIDQDLLFIETHISEALENSRKITYELSPPVLYHLGIIEALNWLLDDVETTHKISCSFYSNVNRVKLSDVKSILLYRSIQEVIKNTIKYAKATLITLDINKKKKGIHILISDDGIGFDTAVLKNLHTHSGSGFGLFTVQERIQNIKGKFKIESEINTGTTVKIFIPLT